MCDFVFAQLTPLMADTNGSMSCSRVSSFCRENIGIWFSVLVNHHKSVDESGQLSFDMKSIKFNISEFRISDLQHWTKVANWTFCGCVSCGGAPTPAHESNYKPQLMNPIFLLTVAPNFQTWMAVCHFGPTAHFAILNGFWPLWSSGGINRLESLSDQLNEENS